MNFEEEEVIDFISHNVELSSTIHDNKQLIIKYLNEVLEGQPIDKSLIYGLIDLVVEYNLTDCISQLLQILEHYPDDIARSDAALALGYLMANNSSNMKDKYFEQVLLTLNKYIHPDSPYIVSTYCVIGIEHLMDNLQLDSIEGSYIRTLLNTHLQYLGSNDLRYTLYSSLLRCGYIPAFDNLLQLLKESNDRELTIKYISSTFLSIRQDIIRRMSTTQINNLFELSTELINSYEDNSLKSSLENIQRMIAQLTLENY